MAATQSPVLASSSPFSPPYPSTSSSISLQQRHRQVIKHRSLLRAYRHHHHHHHHRAGSTIRKLLSPVLAAAGRPPGSGGPAASEKAAREADDQANVVLRLAWYGAEALGNIVAAFNPKPSVALSDSPESIQGPLTREYVVSAVKDDYARGYFVTGDVTTGIYEEDCEFADPAGSFRSLKRFKNNCSNFGSLLEKSDVKLTKSEEFSDKFVAYWRFSCVLKFPWRPILASTGFTEYYFDATTGRICRHKENWDVPKMALLGQVFKPNPSLRKK